MFRIKPAPIMFHFSCNTHKSKMIRFALIICFSSRVFTQDVIEKKETILKFPVYAYNIPAVNTRSVLNGGTENLSCRSSVIINSIQALRKKIKCTPRETIVEVEGPNGLVALPSAVVVKRCGGICSGPKVCIATNTTLQTLYVQVFNETSGTLYCNAIPITEDVKCKCSCPEQKRKKCHANQIYDKNLCKCVCTNTGEIQECNGKGGDFKWDSNKCACICKHKKSCTTGSVWLPTKCRCISLPKDVSDRGTIK